MSSLRAKLSNQKELSLLLSVFLKFAFVLSFQWSISFNGNWHTGMPESNVRDENNGLWPWKLLHGCGSVQRTAPRSVDFSGRSHIVHARRANETKHSYEAGAVITITLGNDYVAYIFYRPLFSNRHWELADRTERIHRRAHKTHIVLLLLFFFDNLIILWEAHRPFSTIESFRSVRSFVCVFREKCLHTVHGALTGDNKITEHEKKTPIAHIWCDLITSSCRAFIKYITKKPSICLRWAID